MATRPDSWRGGRVVVVNDDLVQLDMITTLLREDGLETTGFSGAAAALNGMNPANPPDLILTDLHMPVIDG